MDVKEVLDALRIDPAILTAGFAGGIVAALRDLALKAIEQVAIVISGTFIGVYVGEPIAVMTHMPPILLAFVIGYSGNEGLSLFYRKVILPRLGGIGGTNAAP